MDITLQVTYGIRTGFLGELLRTELRGNRLFGYPLDLE